MINQKSNRKKLKTIAILSAITICSSIALGTVESEAKVTFMNSLNNKIGSLNLNMPKIKMPKIKMPKIKMPKITMTDISSKLPDVELVNPVKTFWGRVKNMFASKKVKTNKIEQTSATPSAPPLDEDLDQLAADVAYSTSLQN